VSSELLFAFVSKHNYTNPAIAITIKVDLSIRFLLDIGALQGGITPGRTWPIRWNPEMWLEISVNIMFVLLNLACVSI